MSGPLTGRVISSADPEVSVRTDCCSHKRFVDSGQLTVKLDVSMKSGVLGMEDGSIGVNKIAPMKSGLIGMENNSASCNKIGPMKSGLIGMENNNAMDCNKLVSMKSGMLEMEGAHMGYRGIPGMANNLFPENLSLQQLVNRIFHFLIKIFFNLI